MNWTMNSFCGRVERVLGWLGAENLGSSFLLKTPSGRVLCTLHPDRVVCTPVAAAGNLREQVITASSGGLAGFMPVMRSLSELAEIDIPFGVALANTLHPQAVRNTAVVYGYHDFSNFKNFRTVVFAGAPTRADVHALVACLRDGEQFVPGQVGLHDLQDSFDNCESYWDPGSDDIWHAVCCIQATDLKPTDARTFSQFVEGVAGLVLQQGWDEGYKPPFYEVMRQRYLNRYLAAA